MKLKIIFLSALFILVVFSNVKAIVAEKVYMPFFELINVHEQFQYSTSKLLKSYIEEQGRYTLVIPERSDFLVDQPKFSEVQMKAQELACNYFIIGDLNRIGETVIVSIAMYGTKSGNMIWSDRLKAATPEDIDPILWIIASTIGTDKKATDEGSIYSVTEYQSRELKQVQSHHYFGVSIGSMFITPKSSFTSGLGVFWFYDLRDVMLNLQCDLYGYGDAHHFGVSIKTLVPIKPVNNTFVFGGGLGIGSISIEEDYIEDSYSYSRDNGGSGLILYASAGYVIGRTSDVGLRIMFDYYVATFSSDTYDEFVPHGIKLNLGLYW